MAIQLINVGAAPNDGTGDTPRAAGQKLNSNFSDASNAASKLIVSSATDTTTDRVLTTGYSAKELSDVTPDAINGSVVQRGALGSADEGTFKIGAPTDPAHPALSGAVRTINPSVVVAPDYYGTLIANLETATGSFDLPGSTPVGGRVLVRKLNATQGIININAPAGETITRAGLSSVQLNSDGDYWLLEKVSLTRWELVDGFETGANSGGEYIRYSNGKQECSGIGTVIGSGVNAVMGSVFTSDSILWNFPKVFVNIPIINSRESGGIGSCWSGLGQQGTSVAATSLQLFRATSATAPYSYDVFASGRWYA